MNRLRVKFILPIAITILAFFYILIPFSKSTHRHASLSDNQEPTSSKVVTTHQSISFFSFLFTLFSKPDAEKITPSEIITYRQVITLDVDEIHQKASFIIKPYTTEDERDKVFKRLEETEALFEEWITTTEKNIATAEREGSKSPDEIEEAKEALREMRNGKGFIAQRMQMVKNDSFQ